jgi:glucuronate isomerase
MKAFLDEDFILQSEAAKTLYHKYAESEPIFDFHNHLSPQEIFENKTLGNLANAWLDHDHYKWRAMRAAGVPEELIPGHIRKDGSVKSDEERGGADAVAKADYERYLAFVRTLQLCVGNPLYHWSHLELKRYFGISEPVTEQNARQVWDKCNALLAKSDYAPRGLLAKMSVRELCTTDDPLDTLEWHKKLADDSTATNLKVRPSFRPDLAINADCPAFADYIARLEKADGTIISSISDMLSALGRRMDFFKENGSVVSDHSLENDFYLPASAEEVNELFKKARAGKTLSHDELAKYKGFVLIELGKLYAKKGFVMQIHIGALRDNNAAMLEAAGKNIGEDSLNDFNFAPQLGAVLNAIYSAAPGARTILYNLNPKDNEALATMAANFRNCQFGPAWWFNDHKDGIEEQIRVYARTAPLGSYVGMLTDSRSFLSYPRHEYFRRILCNYIGGLVEEGEFPWNETALGELVKNICYSNSLDFFGLK